MARNTLGARIVLVAGKRTQRYRFDHTWKIDDRTDNGSADGPVLLIADIDVITKEITIPRTPHAEIPLLVATELKRSHFLDPSSIVFDWHLSAEDASQRTLTVHIAKRAKIDECIAAMKRKDIRIVRIVPRMLIAGRKSAVIDALTNNDGALHLNFLPAEERAALADLTHSSLVTTGLRIAALAVCSLAASLILVSIAARIEAHTARSRYNAIKSPQIDAAYASYSSTSERYRTWRTLIGPSASVFIERIAADCPPDITFTGISIRPSKNAVMEIRGISAREEAASAFVDTLNRMAGANARLRSLERDKDVIVFRISLSLPMGAAYDR